MSNLTQKQESFCLAYIETGNASEAYRRSYNVSKMSEAAISIEAHRLMEAPKISLRVEELRKPAREKAQLTLEQHLNDLKKLRDMAQEGEKYSAAVSAEVSRGRASGLYVERVEHNAPDLVSELQAARKRAEAAASGSQQSEESQ